KILHLDLDAFFCSVEEKYHPELRGKAFVVGGRPDQRGVVASASYPARVFGVRSAMPTSRALRLCPGLIIAHGGHHRYSDISDQVMERIAALTPLVEQVSIDEAFLDVTDLPQTGLLIALQLQQRINTELELPCSIGIASNKLVAKTATDVGKASRTEKACPPNSILEVPPGEEAAFLAPLPVQALWGIGPKTAARLGELGVRSVGDILRIPESQLTHHFGKTGPELGQRARGIDLSPVVTSHTAKSVSQEITFDRDIQNRTMLEKTLRELSEKVCYRLRQDGFTGMTVKIKVRWPDFNTLTRQVTLRQPTDQDSQVCEAALFLFDSIWKPGQAVRLLGVGVSRLGSGLHQLSLWDTQDEKEHRLLEAVDVLRERYGSRIIRKASEIENKSSKTG
ncbi:MAG: DNA polymerase IV, partial [Anaerolineaceae bacterium]|nr:DNA polymerase IV [Anaerolineaceae bacterium]